MNRSISPVAGASAKLRISIRSGILITSSLLTLWLGGGKAQAQFTLQAAPEYFIWQEEVNGQKLVEETGFRFGLELVYRDPKPAGWTWAGRVKGYFGSVDYDGALQNHVTGALTPLDTTTDYYGLLLEGQFGHRWRLGEHHHFSVLGGLGTDLWLRRLGSQFGYDEFWFVFYGKLGVEVNPVAVGWIAAAGLKYPFYVGNTFAVSGLGTFTLAPKGEISAYAEGGYRFSTHFSAAVFFDSYFLGQSEPVLGAFQPASNQYEIGLKIGWTF